ncbi:N-acetylglucosamine-6-phosphate deacetylase [Shewanella sp. A3A]|nr:N-acetylglucosamine-6-phosphate deacetylase [Shewanella ferrihydritica]
MTQYLVERLFDGNEWLAQVLLTIDNGRISAMTPDSQASDATALRGTLVAGLVDVQVNGGGGVQFNQAPSVATLAQMAQAHLACGTTSMMPTLITDKFEVMQQGADAIAAYRKQYPHGSIVGVHFEGPHLSLAKKGMHSADCIRQITRQDIDIFCRQDLGQVLLTVAPETVSPAMITELTEAGVIVSLGHSDASAEQCLAAFAAGATGTTHLFNAMSQLTGRSPGLVGAALDSEQVYCGLIVDHHHVHPLNSRLAIKVKGEQRLMLITDAMAPVGSDIDHFFYQGVKVYRQQNRLTLDNGTIAGSVLSMIEAVQNTHNDLGFALAQTLNMASKTPATFLGLEQQLGQLQPGCVANMLLLNDQLAIEQCWLHGELQRF